MKEHLICPYCEFPNSLSSHFCGLCRRTLLSIPGVRGPAKPLAVRKSGYPFATKRSTRSVAPAATAARVASVPTALLTKSVTHRVQPWEKWLNEQTN